MSYSEGKKQPYIPLLIIYFIALSLRLVLTLVLGGIAFWDPHVYYGLILYHLRTYDSVTIFQNTHIGFHSLNLVMTVFTVIPPFTYARFFPPFFNALTILPMYLLTKELLRNKRAALCASTFFALTDIIVLRQSYLLPEGTAVYFMILVYYLILKAVYSGKFWRYSFLACVSFYCLCAFHNLTSTMTIIPLVVTMFILPFSIRFSKSFSGRVIAPNRFRKFLKVAIAIAIIYILWARGHQFISYISNYISIDVIGAKELITRERDPTTAKFVEHHISIGELTFLDVATMCSGTLLLSFIAVISYLKRFRRAKKDIRLSFLLTWFLTTGVIFIGNVLLDSMFGESSAGMQGYRAWLFMLIPIIILTSKLIVDIQDKLIFQAILVSSLIIVGIGAVWLVGYMIESFPHYPMY